ncbi:heterokaryon incompatibility protein [Coleophoma crateriformis]|uniref:Heterokaryon incompatibility protein n=1 Tax=Coleophoma crateriformis TaxID=565419 RepID=A0A3D8Q4X0_9HELO|nr:heterokaryon incompatibility protein [Coleophoma crateriformis]
MGNAEKTGRTGNHDRSRRRASFKVAAEYLPLSSIDCFSRLSRKTWYLRLVRDWIFGFAIVAGFPANLAAFTIGVWVLSSFYSELPLIPYIWTYLFNSSMDRKVQDILEYQPLKPNSGFRILVLEPSLDFASTIKGELLHADLADHPPFEALSYVWGQSSETRPLEVGGRTFNATVNLECALRYLRLPNTSRHLWVDAICIHQTDDAEKSNHIGYMSEIYRRCTADLLWVGEQHEIIDNAVVAMDYFGNLLGLDETLRNYYTSEYYGTEKAEKEEKLINGLRCLFAELAVWKRVWIVQEIAFAPSVLLVAGHSTLLWEKVEDFLDADAYVERYGIPDAFHGPFSHDISIRSWASGAIAYPQIMSHQRRVVRDSGQGDGSSLLDVLARFRYTNSTDPRDKIYGLLGLVSEKLAIKIDYSRPIKEVYMDCMKRLIEHSQNLDLLCQTPWQLYGNKDRSTDLPSWAIDFANPGHSAILFAQRSIFNAGGDKLDLPISISDGILKLSGVCLGSLESMPKDGEDQGSPPYPPGAKRALQWMPDALIHEVIRNGNPTLSTFLKNKPPTDGSAPPPGLLDNSKTDETSISFSSSFECFWRTIMMDISRYPMSRLTRDKIDELAPKFLEWISTPFDKDRDIDLDFFVQGKMSEWYQWQFAISDGGTYSMVPIGAEVGDYITVLRGAKVPMVLRSMTAGEVPLSNDFDGTLMLVGPCYVHGFMDGQAFDRDSSFPEREFDLL